MSEESRDEVRLPDLGDVGDVVVVEWMKAVGDPVAAGDDLVEVETEKTTFLVAAPSHGRLGSIRVVAGGRATTGEILGEIERG